MMFLFYLATLVIIFLAFGLKALVITTILTFIILLPLGGRINR